MVRVEGLAHTNDWGLKEVKVQMLERALGTNNNNNNNNPAAHNGKLANLCSDLREDLCQISNLSCSVSSLEASVHSVSLELERISTKQNRQQNEMNLTKQLLKNQQNDSQLDSFSKDLQRAESHPMAQISKSLEICFESEEHLKRLRRENESLKQELRNGKKSEQKQLQQQQQSFLSFMHTERHRGTRNNIPNRLELAEKISRNAIKKTDAPAPTPTPTPTVAIDKRASSLRVNPGNGSNVTRSPPSRHASVKLTPEHKPKKKHSEKQTRSSTPSTTATSRHTRGISRNSSASSTLAFIEASTHRGTSEASSLAFEEPPPTSPASTSSSSLALMTKESSRTSIRSHSSSSLSIEFNEGTERK
eukprot:TRINITY_DN19258_c0_g1_i1.p1 TRINITY_DN19258_c0_g1~~TRINITY_DN19258_c0_g1_i1.p1  ORF type:complete len:362 (+),score=68.59 TRINITY_DN19258_c0_g1_i1:232-1317(+)